MRIAISLRVDCHVEVAEGGANSYTGWEIPLKNFLSASTVFE